MIRIGGMRVSLLVASLALLLLVAACTNPQAISPPAPAAVANPPSPAASPTIAPDANAPAAATPPPTQNDNAGTANGATGAALGSTTGNAMNGPDNTTNTTQQNDTWPYLAPTNDTAAPADNGSNPWPPTNSSNNSTTLSSGSLLSTTGGSAPTGPVDITNDASVFSSLSGAVGQIQ